MRRLFILLISATVLNCQTACSSDTEEIQTPDGMETNDTASHYTIRTQELFCDNDGKVIYGIVYLPEGKTGKMPTVIYSHGFGGTNGGGASYARALAEHGYVCYCFDFCGGSSASRSDGRTTEMSIFTEQGDLETVIAAISRQDYVDTGNLFLLGASQGGMVSAMTAAAHTDEIKGLMLLYPALCIADDARRRFNSLDDVPQAVNLMGMTIGRTYYEHLFDFDTYANITPYSKDVLIIHGDRDNIVPISYSERATQAYPSAVLETIHGAGHGFSGNNMQRAIDYIFGYLLQHVN